MTAGRCPASAGTGPWSFTNGETDAMAVTRLVSAGDAEPLARLLTANRDYLAPWSPLQDDAYFTAAGQREVIGRQIAAYERGAMLPLLIVDSGGELSGSINLNSIIRGAFQNASV